MDNCFGQQPSPANEGHSAPWPENENARLADLCQYEILDTEAEDAFDELTWLAAKLCETPIALISLIDTDRQWFKSKVGLEVSETPRTIAFCSHTILQNTPLIVPDTLEDERFANNPLVIESPCIRFYAGTPLLSPDGHALGTLCVIDTAPRELRKDQIELLQVLGHQVVSLFRLRRKLLESDRLKHAALLQEAALRESEARFRIMADSAPVMIWMDDENKQAIFHNLTWQKFTGRSHKQHAGKGWMQSVHPDDRAATERDYVAAFDAKAPYSIEYRLMRADNQYRWVLETGVPRFLADDTFAGFTGSCIDINDRKSAEQDSQLLKEVTHAIVNSADFYSALAIALEKVCEATQWEFGEAWVPNSDKMVMECSSAWYSKSNRFTEFRRQSQDYTFAQGVGIPGRVWLFKKFEWHQDVSVAAPEVYPRVQLALEAGFKATLGIPLLANDTVISVLVFYMSESRQEDQRLINLITASTELGLFIQRKQSEEEVRKALAKEQELNQFKSNFIANISHELRTPLTAVLGLSSVLLEQYYGSINPKQKQYLSLIHSSGDHLLNLINDLLDLAKINSGKQELNKGTVSVAELCNNAVEMMEVKASEKGLLIRLELTVAIDSIVADHQRVLQILLNYLSNAVKFTPTGGMITLTSRLASGAECNKNTLAVSTPTVSTSDVATDAQFLVLDVKDTGVGISQENQSLLFRTFQQVDANEHQYKGSGLGLALSKQLAELHDGRVSFSSVAGHGSTFSVWLPILTD